MVKYPNNFMHPHLYTLNLLKEIIDNIPLQFPQNRKIFIIQKYQEMLTKEDVPLEEIESLIAQFGKEVWPYRKAFERMFQNYGREKLKKYVLGSLDPSLQDKYEKYLEYHEQRTARVKESVESITAHQEPTTRKPGFLTSEEYLQIESAEIDNKIKTVKELEELIEKDSARKKEFEGYKEEYQKQRELFEGKLEELKSLAIKYPQLSAEINESIKKYQESFSIISVDPSLVKLGKKIEYFQGLAGEPI